MIADFTGSKRVWGCLWRLAVLGWLFSCSAVVAMIDVIGNCCPLASLGPLFAPRPHFSLSLTVFCNDAYSPVNSYSSCPVLSTVARHNQYCQQSLVTTSAVNSRSSQPASPVNSYSPRPVLSTVARHNQRCQQSLVTTSAVNSHSSQPALSTASSASR